MQEVRFEDTTSTWFVAGSKDAVSGTEFDISDPIVNATKMKNRDFNNIYLIKSAS